MNTIKKTITIQIFKKQHTLRPNKNTFLNTKFDLNLLPYGSYSHCKHTFYVFRYNTNLDALMVFKISITPYQIVLMDLLTSLQRYLYHLNVLLTISTTIWPDYVRDIIKIAERWVYICVCLYSQPINFNNELFVWIIITILYF